MRWCEQPDTGDDEGAEPPAMVILTIDTPTEYREMPMTGWELQAELILPAVRDWLDMHGVPRTAWWWRDEIQRSYHPGVTDVTALADLDIQRETWTPPS